MAHLQPLGLLDLVLAPASLAMLVGYHAFLCYKVRRCPMQTVLGINQKARRLWVYEMLVENHKKNVLAVQTLRNSIMEATLMATTAVLLTAALATYLTFASTMIRQLQPPAVATAATVGGAVGGTVKAMALIASLMASFVCHTQSIRFLNYVNYMVNIPMLLDPASNSGSSGSSGNSGNSCSSGSSGNSCSSGSSGSSGNGHGLLTPDYIADLLGRATDFYTMGSRSFYLCFPLLLWTFGSVPMFVTSVALIHALYHSDFVDLPSPPALAPKESEACV